MSNEILDKPINTEILSALKLRDEYYHSFPAMINITRMLTFRYMAFSNRDKDKGHMNRYNRGYHREEFFKTYDRFNFAGIQYLRLYLCLTTLRTDFPILPRSGDQREKIKKYIQENLQQWVTGFDMGWDFDLKETISLDTHEQYEFDMYKEKYKDCPIDENGVMTILSTNDNLKILLKDVIKLGQFLASYGVAYSITFSGRRGFHLRIPGDYLHPILQKNWERVALMTKKIALFNNELDIDTFGSDLMKLFKLPYSVDGKAPIFYLVLPLSESQLESWSLEKMRLDYCMRTLRFVNKDKSPRGLIMIGFKDMETQYENTLKMFNSIEGW